MKAIKDFTANAPIKGLEPGAYVVEIKAAEEVTYNNGGSGLKISFDIAEGDNKGYYAAQYKNSTDDNKRWKGCYYLSIPTESSTYYDVQKRTFSNAIWYIEQSNSGYHWAWDEKTLKGKKVGMLFRNEEWEYNGKSGWRVTACGFTLADDVREGKIKMPKDKPLKKAAAPELVALVGDEDDLPF